MNSQERRDKLEASLLESGLDFEFIHPSNLSEPIILIKNYTSNQETPLASFAFTLIKYYEGNSSEMCNKCWMTCSKVKKIGDMAPNPHPGYGEFSHNGDKYFPFSVNPPDFTYDCIDTIKGLCRNLYAHLDFE